MMMTLQKYIDQNFSEIPWVFRNENTPSCFFFFLSFFFHCWIQLFSPHQRAPGSPECWCWFPGMRASPGSTNTRVPLGKMLEDTQSSWLWECGTSERRKDLVSSKRHLRVLDWELQHFKEFCRKSTGLEKCLPPEEQQKCSSSAGQIRKSSDLCMCYGERASPSVWCFRVWLLRWLWWCSLWYLSPPWCLYTALEAHNRLYDQLYKTDSMWFSLS